MKAAAPTWQAEMKDVEATWDRSFLTAQFDKHQVKRMAEEGHEIQTQHCDCRAQAATPFDSTRKNFVLFGWCKGELKWFQTKVGNRATEFQAEEYAEVPR